MRVNVLPKRQLMVLNPLSNTAAIRITTEPSFDRLNNQSEFVDVLELYFDDSSENEVSDSVHGRMNVDHYFKIKNFVNKCIADGNVNNIIVSCDAGQSRSPAVALGIIDFILNDPEQAQRLLAENGQWKPNVHVVSFFRKDYYNQI